jgi:hypothetical protein
MTRYRMEWRGWNPAGGIATVAVVLVTTGCHRPKQVEPVSIRDQWLGSVTIAVAPAINLTGGHDVDSDRFADLMASELSYADGVSVVPVSRVLNVLGAQGMQGIESPSHALELAKLLGADAILVFAVTEYDPYDPPRVGVTAQLYGSRPGAGGGIDPVALSRQAGLAGDTARRVERGVLAQSQRVFNASHEDVVADIKSYARHRGSQSSPYGWRRFVVSQQDFVRYCCYATIRALLDAHQESERAEQDREG